VLLSQIDWRTVPIRAMAILAVAATAVPAGASAQEDVLRGSSTASYSDAHAAAPRIQALRRQDRIDIDGRLDEPEWQRAHVVSEFIQTEPDEGRPATERTEVYILYDDDALYIGARMWDSSGEVRSRLGRRDSMLGDSDWFYVMIDSHHDHLTAYQFSANPAGVKRDETVASGARNDGSWDAVWQLGTSIDDDGWTAEYRIPFSQLRFSAADVQTWGIQLSRRINSRQEVSVFSFTPRGMRGGVARYGHLDGLEGLRPGRRLEVMPYVLGRAEYIDVKPDNPFRSGRDHFGGVGLDAKYRLTSALTLDATINPDFGQVEADPAVVNLSAAETSLQERRPFFVEGSDIFRFGDARLFYSRRIGRAPQGSLPGGTVYSDRPDASTILGAAKLSGRTQRGLSIGIVQAVTGEESAPWQNSEGSLGSSVVEPLTNYLTGRLVRDFRSGQTQVGALATSVHRRLDDERMERLLHGKAYTGGIDVSHQFLNRTWSADASVAFSHVAGSEAAIVRTQLLSSRYFQRPDAGYVDVDSTRTSMAGYAANVEVGRRAGQRWRGEASVSVTSPGFEINDMGFQTSVDRVSSKLNVQYMQNTPSVHFRSWRINGGPEVNWNHGGDFLGGLANLNLNGQFANFWSGMIGLNKRIVGYDDRLTRGGPIARDRAGQSVSFFVNTDGRQKVSGRISGNVNWGAGEGRGSRVSINMSARPADNWSMSIGPSFSTNLSTAQYVTAITDTVMAATYGRRYIFAGLDQTTVSMDTRFNVNFTPEFSLELFAQPFVSSADYLDLKQLRAPGTFEFDVYGSDIGTIAYDEVTRRYAIDPDNGGPARKFTLANRDFNTRSLRGNAVLRWEYRPGSSLFLVWQQRRSETFARGDFDLMRDSRALFDAPPNNIFVIKASYWLNL
jgi:hypothetical protein